MNTLLPTPVGLQRVFIGIPVDQRFQLQTDDLLKPIKNLKQDVRWVPENNRHVTLAFLGNRSGAEIENLLRLFDETYQGEAHFQYRFSSLKRFPKATSRIIALTGKTVEPMECLFQNTLKLLQKNRIEIDRKTFRPHVTLGRIRKPKQMKTSYDQPTNVELEVSKIRLYQSTLTNFGSVYSTLKEVQLN